jgi:hypothetical protein
VEENRREGIENRLEMLYSMFWNKHDYSVEGTFNRTRRNALRGLARLLAEQRGGIPARVPTPGYGSFWQFESPIP